MRDDKVAKSLPPLTWFRAFEASARLLSFTRAADELGFTQSAISQHVRALEERLGNPLFVRGHRTLHLTQAGRLLVPDVTAAIAQLGRATQRFQPEAGKTRLNIATSASIAQWVIAPHMAAFQRANPQIALQIATTIWPDDFTTTNADVEIRFGMGDVVGHQAALILPSVLQAVASPDVVAQLPSGGVLSDMAHVPLIQPVGISQTWTRLGAQLDDTPLDPVIFVDTHGLAVDLAVSGAGVALTHALVSRAAVAKGHLTVLPITAVDADEGYYLSPRPSAVPEARDAFIDWFENVVSPLH